MKESEIYSNFVGLFAFASVIQCIIVILIDKNSFAIATYIVLIGVVGGLVIMRDIAYFKESEEYYQKRKHK